MHGIVHGTVACAHDLRKAKKADQSDEKSSERGLKVLRPAWEGLEARSKIADRFRERDRGQTTDDAEDGVSEKFGGTLEGGDRNSEKRFASKK